MANKFSKNLNSEQFINIKVKILDKGLHWPNLRDVSNFPYICQ